MSTISRPTREKKKNPILDEYLDDDDMQLISTTPITNNLSRNRVKKPITKHRTSKKYRFEEIIESNPDHLAMIKLCKNGNAGTEGSSTRFNVKDSVYVVHDTLSGKANFRGEIVTRVIYKWKSKGQEVRYDVDYDDKDKDFGCDGKFICSLGCMLFYILLQILLISNCCFYSLLFTLYIGGIFFCIR